MIIVYNRFIPKFGFENIYAITVGSESLYRKELTGVKLAAKIKEVKDVLKELGADSIPVGFADSWNMIVASDAKPAIEASNIILANAFSYWQGQKMDNATHSFFDDIMRTSSIPKRAIHKTLIIDRGSKPCTRSQGRGP